MNPVKKSSSISLIVPYRDREDHLKKFIPHYRHYFPSAEIIVVEQDDDKPFNRGYLLNVGFLASTRDTVIFHDVDMIVASGMHYYSLPAILPTQLATKVQQFGYKMPFKEYFGGVTKFSREQFITVNGFSNLFTNWGGEDCDLYEETIKHYGILYPNVYYNSLPHERQPYFCLPNDHPNYIRWKQGRQPGDGLSAIKMPTIDWREFDRTDYAHLMIKTNGNTNE